MNYSQYGLPLHNHSNNLLSYLLHVWAHLNQIDI